MENQSFQEKEVSGVKRLSESRPMFKPVLVKKLLADESDDESDDQTVNSDNSDDELDDLDGLQPLAEECTLKVETEKDLENQSNANVSPTVNMLQETERKGILNSYLKDSSNISNNVINKSDTYELADKNIALNDRRSVGPDVVTFESQGHLKSNSVLDKRKSVPIKSQVDTIVGHRSHSADGSAQSHKDNIAEQRRYSIKQNKTSFGNDNNDVPPITVAAQQSAYNTVNETPMKHPQVNVRPNPCHSHRNIFQTPQNKTGNEIMKNSLQTPATIFSHWSQQHMLQTPMHSRESLQTPITNSSLPHTSRENQRYYSVESKTVRRPLAETMSSSQPYGLPRLQEAPNESKASPALSRETIIQGKQEHLMEKKPVYTTATIVHDTKENSNPNNHEILKNDQHQKVPSATELRNPVSSYQELKPNVPMSHNPPQSQRVVDNYNSYQKRECHNLHPSPVTSQAEPMQNIQCPIPQQNNAYNPRQHKIITVKDRQYMVLGVIGQGMSCEVVRAQDLSTSELRAIKCVNLSKFDKDSAQGCLQEICMLDKLKAPCIVHMYSFEIKQPWVHVVMEIGDTDLSRLLKSMLQEKKKIPLTMILYYWTEMLTAVKHIHDNGVIHSDLKPANFLLVRGRLKLIDFGIASNINADMTSVVKNCTIGTLNYISPEALVEIDADSTNSPNHHNKYKISYKSDVWSLGCILYQLVYNVTPFGHIRQQWAKMNAITDPKTKINYPLTNGSEQVPRILIDVMNKCLQRDVKARPTVADLLKIPYLQSNISPSVSVPSIPNNILMKIKRALTEDEWKQLTEILDKRRS